MKVSTRGKYAMIAMVRLALQDGQAAVSAKELAAVEGISLAYLEQLFVKLRRSGLLSSVRGPNGGFRLARDADEIRVSEILDAVDETVDALQAGAGARRGETGSKAEHLSDLMWEGLSAHVHVYLHQMTLQDIISKNQTPCPALPSFMEIGE